MIVKGCGKYSPIGVTKTSKKFETKWIPTHFFSFLTDSNRKILKKKIAAEQEKFCITNARDDTRSNLYVNDQKSHFVSCCLSGQLKRDSNHFLTFCCFQTNLVLICNQQNSFLVFFYCSQANLVSIANQHIINNKEGPCSAFSMNCLCH